ncbi:hypothetical protein I4U23_023594 [Adineta vaga]|nr:hypothetical protein I4U23_023594 [Adineta vaga]
MIICITQFILSLFLCTTTNVKVLKSVLIVATIIFIIIFFFIIQFLMDFVDVSREKFSTLIRRYPNGEIPNESSLLLVYSTIKDGKCCGIDHNRKLSIKEIIYFGSNFPQNCHDDCTFKSVDLTKIFQYQSCMNVIKDLHSILSAISTINIILITIMIILFWIYIILLQRKQKRMNQPMTYPLNSYISGIYNTSAPPTGLF